MITAIGLSLTAGVVIGFVLAAVLVGARDERDRIEIGRMPQPDWGSRGTVPKGKAGPKPPPNGRLVATKPPPGPSNIIVRTPNPLPAPKNVREQ